MKRVFFLLVLVPFLLKAQQDTGVHFENGLGWAAIQAKAKAENKYIFMDCYTTWCGPCRFMATEIFPRQESGSYFNDKFVSVTVQLDSTAKDADNIKAWYADGHDIAGKYNVRAYPTYLIFAPDGHVVHRLVGSRLTPKDFIADVSEAFDTTKQYYTLLDEYRNGRHDTAFLHKLAMICVNAYDIANGKKITGDYLSSQPDLMNKDALQLADTYTLRSNDKYFTLFTDRAAEIDKILGPGAAEAKVRGVFLTEGAGRKLDDNRPPDWAAVRTKIAAHLPAEADELTARVRVNFYRGRKDWPNFEKAIVDYMKTYGSKITDDELNDLAWSVFQNCPDMTCVSEVLDWSKRLKENNNASTMDTYANILYKLGKKDEAIALETKVLKMVPDADKSSFQETLNKMKNGEKTW
jgi:thioredoxin-related protein